MSIFADFLTSWILPSKPPQSRRSKIIQKSSLLTLGALGFAFFSGTVFSIKTVHGVFQVLANFREKMIKNQPFFEAKKEEAAVAPRGVSNSIPSRSKGSCSNREGKITSRLRRPQRPYALLQTQRGQKNWIHRTQAHLRPCTTRVTPPS